MKRTLPLFVMISFLLASSWALAANSPGIRLSNAAGQVDSSPGAGRFFSSQSLASIIGAQTQFVAGAGSGHDDFSPVDYGAFFLFGRGSDAAFTLGATHSTASGAEAILKGSVAAELSRLVQLGIGMDYNTDSSDVGGGVSVLLQMTQALRMGLNAYWFSSNPEGFGAGVAYDFTPQWTLGADLTSDEDLKNPVVTAGLRYVGRVFSLGFGYALAMDDGGGSNPVQPAEVDHLYGALGLILARNFSLEFYYRHQSQKYFAALAVSF